MVKIVSLLIFVSLYQFFILFGKSNFDNSESNGFTGIPINGQVHAQLDDNITNDTLHLVLKDEFLYYPFGAFDDIESLQNSQPKTFITSKKMFAPYKDNSFKKEKIYYLTANNSYLGAYFNKNTKKCEIVSSIILNNQIPLKNGISIGITKDDFLKIITNNPVIGKSTLNIVQVASQNKGINHFYKFADNKLVEIKILSEHFYTLK